MPGQHREEYAMTQPKMIIRAIRMPDALWALLSEAAERIGSNASALTRLAVYDWLERDRLRRQSLPAEPRRAGDPT
jgi:hypothetical protein